MKYQLKIKRYKWFCKHKINDLLLSSKKAKKITQWKGDFLKYICKLLIIRIKNYLLFLFSESALHAFMFLILSIMFARILIFFLNFINIFVLHKNIVNEILAMCRNFIDVIIQFVPIIPFVFYCQIYFFFIFKVITFIDFYRKISISRFLTKGF